MTKEKPTSLERLVKGLGDGVCIAGDPLGAALIPPSAGRYGRTNRDSLRREMGGTKMYKAGKAVGFVSVSAMHVATSGVSAIVTTLGLNAVKVGYSAYRRYKHKNEY